MPESLEFMDEKTRKLTLELSEELIDLMTHITNMPENKFTGNPRRDNRESIQIKGAAENLITKAIFQRFIDVFGIEAVEQRGINLADYDMRFENGEVNLHFTYDEEKRPPPSLDIEPV